MEGHTAHAVSEGIRGPGQQLTGVELAQDLRGLACAGLARAEAAGIPTKVLDHRSFAKDREAFERAIDAELGTHGVELVCLAGFLRRLTPWFVART